MCFSCNCNFYQNTRDFLGRREARKKKVESFPVGPQTSHTNTRCCALCLSSCLFPVSSIEHCMRASSLYPFPNSRFLFVIGLALRQLLRLAFEKGRGVCSSSSFIFVTAGLDYRTIRNFEQTGLNCTLVCQIVQLCSVVPFLKVMRVHAAQRKVGACCALEKL
jgi:hypothetical protein